MNNLAFTLKRIRFDENYNPSKNTRATTNFANLARGEKRQENLNNALVMIDNRFNSLAHWDNPKGDRYSVELEIISAELNLRPGSSDETFPAIEILKTHIVDHKTGQRTEGLSAITSLPMCVIMISALFCQNITKVRLNSACQMILVSCMAIFSKVS